MLPSFILAIENESDREFMEQVYINYNRLVVSTVLPIVRNLDEAEDLMQSTMEKMIDKIPTLRQFDHARMANYLIAAGRNTAYNHMKAKNKPVFSFDDCIEVGSDQEIRDIEDTVAMREDLRRMWQIWPQLKERTRYILEARYILGKSTAEIAQDLNIDRRSVRMATHRARKEVREKMEKKPLPRVPDESEK